MNNNFSINILNSLEFFEGFTILVINSVQTGTEEPFICFPSS